MGILINFIITMIIIISAVFILIYLEKHTTALFTLQNKPSVQGLNSILQNTADALKLLFKEDCPTERKKILHFIAPLTAFCSIVAAFCLIPINNFYTISDSFPSAILFIALILIPAIAVFLAGYSSGKQPLISAISIISNTIAFGIPSAISILAISFMASTLNINGIILEQSGSTGLFNWYFIPQIAGCIVFFICTFVFLNCLSFDSKKAENWLISGYTAEYSGLKYGLFTFSRYAFLFLISAFFVCIYFGGYLSPFGTYVLPDFLIPLEQIFWLLLKIFLATSFIFLIKAALPKPDYRSFLEFSYKILLPLSLINLNIVILICYLTGVQ